MPRRVRGRPPALVQLRQRDDVVAVVVPLELADDDERQLQFRLELQQRLVSADDDPLGARILERVLRPARRRLRVHRRHRGARRQEPEVGLRSFYVRVREIPTRVPSRRRAPGTPPTDGGRYPASRRRSEPRRARRRRPHDVRDRRAVVDAALVPLGVAAGVPTRWPRTAAGACSRPSPRPRKLPPRAARPARSWTWVGRLTSRLYV